MIMRREDFAARLRVARFEFGHRSHLAVSQHCHADQAEHDEQRDNPEDEFFAFG
jgi:hypothetical protein